MASNENSGNLESEIPARHSGKRLDEILAELYPERSKAALQKLVRRGKVILDGERVLRSNVRPRRRARLRLKLEEPQPIARAAQLDVIFEDEDLIVINKPAGLLTHGNEKERGTSLSDLVAERFGRLPILMGEHRAGVVHRLDRETSGLIVLARTGSAMESLRLAFRERKVKKDYLALVHGRPIVDEQVLRWDLGPVAGHPDRQEVLSPGRGKSAETWVDLEEELGACSLLRCRPRTGRRHQVRVHLCAAGASIVGDKIYGAKRAPSLPAGAPSLSAHALHAQAIRLNHPGSGEEVCFEAPLRGEMEALISWLRS
ncbi:MAG: 23S rRNA pseudouridine1911/1915/1917 synthase [Candidatus Paceibacteria bacterium]